MGITSSAKGPWLGYAGMLLRKVQSAELIVAGDGRALYASQIVCCLATNNHFCELGTVGCLTASRRS